jgi:glycosyltransferase involved in cell wall biosynthesis
MSTNDPPNSTLERKRGSTSVVLAVDADQAATAQCMRSLASHAQGVTVLDVEPSSVAVNRALAQLAPADVIVLSEPCRVTQGWVERLRAAARADTNTATASALADAGTPLALALGDQAPPPLEAAALSERLAERTLALHPRLDRAVGPCVYVRREAIELVGALDESLALKDALEIDFAQRCVLSGMGHVAADDVVVERLAPGAEQPAAQEIANGLSRPLDDRDPRPHGERHACPGGSPAPADSDVLAHALHNAREPPARLAVTLDARALDGAVTGTQVHVLELILALAGTEALKLRLLVREERIDPKTRELLQRLPHTELLAAGEVDQDTPRTAVFHRPQQTFSPGDVALALALGERVVLSQLDLIAYRNPGYFDDAAAWEDFRAANRHGLAAAERVVVFSDHTRGELLADALVEQTRIRVVPPGLDHRRPGEPRMPPGLHGDPDRAAPDGADAGAAGPDAAVALDAGFLLCLGNDFRHKNRLFALRLLAALREHHGWEGRLVLAGGHVSPGSSRRLEQAFLQQHPELQQAVVTLGPVSEQEKAWLLAHAAALVYPSVYEGFGLVPFESALSGTPCLFAAQASLAEVAPEGGATIVPWDPRASAAAAHELLSDPAACERHVRLLAGRAQSLTWSATAAAMVEVYREAMLAPVREAATLSRDLVRREARLAAYREEVEAHFVAERELVLRDYEQLRAQVGFSLSLIGPQGSLPEGLQRALLALSARPAISRPLFGALSAVFIGARALGRPLRRLLSRTP